MNNRKGRNHDPIGTIAALSLIRISYGRQALAELERRRGIVAKARAGGRYWSRYVDPDLIARPAADPSSISNHPIEMHLEEHRRWFAEILQTDLYPTWHHVADLLGERGVEFSSWGKTTRCGYSHGPRVGDFWRRVAIRARIG